MRVLVAMSGGVDSSVAAALLQRQGHDVTGVTLKLWGGESDSGCCSVADVDDARRVAQQLDIDHLIFNFGDDFAAQVVAPYVESHRKGATPNPCIECNRHLKFDRLLARAEALGFDVVATGHHARVDRVGGDAVLRRGADPTKDQSYVLYVLDQQALRRVAFPVGHLTKSQVRAEAARLGLRTADKPDSQDVCFITSAGGRAVFLGSRIALHPGRVVDGAGREVGEVPHVELVTVGQRRGLGVAGAGEPRYVTAVDPATRTVTVGAAGDLLEEGLDLHRVCWTGSSRTGTFVAQCSAHGTPRPVTVTHAADGLRLTWDQPARRVAPGQSVVLFDRDVVVGGGIRR